MPRRYNYLATITPNDYAIGICPVCNIRLTHGCEHSQSDDYQEWLAAQVVCEVYGELSDTEARALHDALVLCATDPLHIINTSLDWQATEVQVNAAYGEVDLSPVQRGEKIPRKPRTKKVLSEK